MILGHRSSRSITPAMPLRQGGGYLIPLWRPARRLRRPPGSGARLPDAGAARSYAAAVGAGDGLGAVDESSGEVGQALVAVAGLVPQQRERLVDVDAQPLGEFALGLLDDDPAVQRGLQLLVEGIAAAHAALVQQADGGHVGQRLANTDAVRVEGTGSGAE